MKYTTVISWLRRAVGEVEKARASVASSLETENGFQAIFVAPEYMFTGENTGKRREPMLVAEKNDVIRDIRDISKSYSNILIFPGSIFYKEALGGSTVELVTATHKAMANLISAELSSSKMSAQDKTDLLGGWRTGGGVAVPGIRDMSTALKKPKADTYRAYNSVQAFLGGEAVIKTPYVKNWDFKETEGASVEKLMYVPGSHSGRRTINNFDFGIEVCFDHANGALKGSRTDVDFHIVVSDWVGSKASSMAMKKGGYFIHASSNPLQTMVCKRESTGALTKLSLAGGKTAADSLAYWVVDVEKRAMVKAAVTTSTGSTVVTSSGKVLPGAVKVM
jgi:hypothetical protein